MITRSDLMAHLAELRIKVPSLADPEPDEKVWNGATAVFLHGKHGRYRVVLNSDYLGCTKLASDRRLDQDMPDGQATLATWQKIAAAIKESEQ